MLILIGGVGFALAGPGAAPAWATSCPGPQLRVSPAVSGPGTKVLVSGFAFGTDCRTGSGPVLGAPQKGVELVVRVGGAEKAVGRIDVGDDYDFVISVQVPPSLGTGTGSVIAVLSDHPPVSAPLEVAGAPGDAGDQPYIDFTQANVARSMSGSGFPWAWIALGIVVGGAGVVLVTTIVGRRRV